ncbi:MAG: helix-turn-helix transcriptional regulator [Eubacterium sp.]|nr:helix-turn-helix transcriptional regulator [Eubacterium sp.]
MAENSNFFVETTINPNSILYNPDKIKYFRKRHHLKRTEFSKLTGISITSLQVWELGQAQPQYKYWRKLYLFMLNYDKSAPQKRLCTKNVPSVIV